MDDVVLTPAGETADSPQAAEDIEERQNPIERGATHAVWRRLVVGEVFPPSREVPEPVDGDPFERLVATALVG